MRATRTPVGGRRGTEREGAAGQAGEDPGCGQGCGHGGCGCGGAAPRPLSVRHVGAAAERGRIAGRRGGEVGRVGGGGGDDRTIGWVLSAPGGAGMR
jgi:hypothetical protein